MARRDRRVIRVSVYRRLTFTALARPRTSISGRTMHASHRRGLRSLSLQLPLRACSRAAGAIGLALALCLLIPLQAAALTWGSPKSLSVWGQTYLWPGSLGATSNNRAHVVYIESVVGTTIVEYRSTSNGAASWGAPFQLSSGAVSVATQPSLAATGLAVDAVWVQGTNTGLKVIYRRSLDAGTTWQRPLGLTSSGISQFPRVARDGAGHVVVAWTDGQTGKIRVRASANGGRTFGSAIVVGTTTNIPNGFTHLQGFPAFAVGSGIIYLAYYTSTSTLRVRRSTSGGASWSAAATLTTSASGYFPGLAANGSKALLGYSLHSGSTSYAVYRRTTDKWSHWSSPSALAATTPPSYEPFLSYSGGAWRAVYERCATSCGTSGAYYRSSTDGVTWSSPATIASAANTFNAPAGVVSAVKVIVVYDRLYAGGVVEAFSRSGS
jgi:hypothetical protein